MIESGYWYLYLKPQYFWAFQCFKTDLGSSRDRPFLRLWGFNEPAAGTVFVDFVPTFGGFTGCSSPHNLALNCVVTESYTYAQEYNNGAADLVVYRRFFFYIFRLHLEISTL